MRILLYSAFFNAKTGVLSKCRVRSFCVRHISQDTASNVTKDVVLFKYDNPQFFRVLRTFGYCQFGFWIYLSHFAFTTLRNVPSPQDTSLPWWRRINFGEKKYRYGITALSLFIGCGILLSCSLYLLRSVRYLILKSGGRNVSFVTYGPFGKEKMTTVSLNEISCEHSRHSSRVQLPIKVQGHRMYYMLDMRGEFTNTTLFDRTAGLKRNLKV